jgi:hypothetical protein
MHMAVGSYEVGVINRNPTPAKLAPEMASLAGEAFEAKRQISSVEETNHLFTIPVAISARTSQITQRAKSWSDHVSKLSESVGKVQSRLDELAMMLYGFNEADVQALETALTGQGFGVTTDTEAAAEVIASQTVESLATALVSWCFGVTLGRWDARIAIDPSLASKFPDPFDPLPICPTGMLVGSNGLPAGSGSIASEEWLRERPDANTPPQEDGVKSQSISDSEYPLRISWNGLLVDDPGGIDGWLPKGTPQPHRDDIVRRTHEVLDFLWKDKAHELEQEACDILGVSDLRDYFRKPTKFFQDHLKRYSKSRRKAPIYWPLSTVSGSYTIWIYYHRLSDQTLYAAVNQYIEPKISEVERGFSRIEDELKAASGTEATRLRDRISETQTFLGELRDLREELLRIAALPYKPDLNDGVIINAAPLNGLFSLRSWANDTKKIWDKLKNGDYDWAHLAYTMWPDRVREVCKRDRSIAIAHGLEDLCEVENLASKKKGGRGRRKKEES